ncbi:IS3 family transposase [Salisediminibacterium beveridgei]|uniref:Putative transposase InsK for insertion sequence element IS150 n=1 Tax=Salisediminibacterium beveridgei TaxID=632773 RepID=A0A1D7QXI6_9BACI|nr:IS3 family transposase [Salisediminibacterium beveridgei]AOM83727.1 Putative transposase InsK for insertion sequence element IS150 [Salisediminibacterium beveridgei]
MSIQELHETKDYPIQELCAIAGVARSAYYKWLNREVPKQEQDTQYLAQLIVLIYHDDEVNQTYVYRRMTSQMNAWGVRCSENKVLRIMRILRIQSQIRKKRKVYPRVNPDHLAKNVLDREFKAQEPNEKWCTDITEMKDERGKKQFLSAVIDLYDNSIVAFKLSKRNDNHLVESTLIEAFAQNPNVQSIIHSDRGSQYTSHMYHDLKEIYGFTLSMSRAGYCIDNQPIERFFGTLKAEYYYRMSFSSTEQLENGIHNYIDFYNWRRVTLTFKGLAPKLYRRQYQGAA